MKLITAALIAVTFAGAFGASAQANDLWSHRLATFPNIAYGDAELQTFDAHLHGDWIGEPTYFTPDSAARDTIVWIHGGGWLQGDKDGEFGRFAPFVERGWNGFNVNYRQGPGTAPQAVDDAMCAYKKITEQLEERGQPVDRIVISGLSAGGHLALTVGLLNADGRHPCRTEHPPRAIVNWFGITDIDQVDEFLQASGSDWNYARTWAGSSDALATVSADYSPMYLITDAAPPIISIHGTDDSVVPYEQAESFHSSLNTPNRLFAIKGGKHMGFSDEEWRAAYDAIFEFLDEHR